MNRMEPKAKVRRPWGCGMILGWMGWGPAMSGGDSLSPKEGALVWSHKWSVYEREDGGKGNLASRRMQPRGLCVLLMS